MSVESGYGYGYGIWLLIKDPLIKTKHVSHVTLCCHVPSEIEVQKLYRGLMLNMPSKLKIKIYSQHTVFEDTYSSHDPYPRAWGYLCEIVDDNIHNLKHNLETLTMDSVSCTLSRTFHTTIEYTNWNRPYDLQESIETECEIVMADIQSIHPEKWSIIKHMD